MWGSRSNGFQQVSMIFTGSQWFSTVFKNFKWFLQRCSTVFSEFQRFSQLFTVFVQQFLIVSNDLLNGFQRFVQRFSTVFDGFQWFRQRLSMVTPQVTRHTIERTVVIKHVVVYPAPCTVHPYFSGCGVKWHMAIYIYIYI